MFRIHHLAARLRSRWAVFVAVLGLTTLLPTGWANGQLAPCDVNRVFHFGKIWVVLPTGTDDTANLQCAFDNAATEHSSTVLLTDGTYHTGQIACSVSLGPSVASEKTTPSSKH